MRTGGRGHAGRATARGVIAAVCALACLVAGEARAQSGKGPVMGLWSTSAVLGYVIPSTDEYGNAFTWRLAAGYSPAPQFEVDFEVGRFLSEVHQPDPNGLPSHTIASGDLEVMPVCLTARYHTFLPGTYGTLSLLAGFGYYFIDYTMDEASRAALAAGADPAVPVQSVDDAWGYHLGVGVEYPLSARLAIIGEGRYLFLSPEARGAAGSGGRVEGSLDLDTWMFTGGLKLAF